MELDDAFANAAYIPNGETYPQRWQEEAEAFRKSARCDLDIPYAAGERCAYDLFFPDDAPKGVVIFVHGGYWLRFDRKDWSHLAAGPLARGWAVAMPSYDLCPTVHIRTITDQIETAITVISDRVSGPIRLAGHSAGGQLVARMMCRDLEPSWRSRVERVMPISPVADLVPLMRTSMNASLGLDAEEAQTESPLNHQPANVPVSVWVGADERPVFIEQATALSEVWKCDLTIEPSRHHFDVIEGLSDPESEMVRTLLG